MLLVEPFAVLHIQGGDAGGQSAYAHGRLLGLDVALYPVRPPAGARPARLALREGRVHLRGHRTVHGRGPRADLALRVDQLGPQAPRPGPPAPVTRLTTRTADPSTRSGRRNSASMRTVTAMPRTRSTHAQPMASSKRPIWMPPCRMFPWPHKPLLRHVLRRGLARLRRRAGRRDAPRAGCLGRRKNSSCPDRDSRFSRFMPCASSGAGRGPFSRRRTPRERLRAGRARLEFAALDLPRPAWPGTWTGRPSP